MDHCPVCGARAIGKVGIDQYFCWDCCVEFMCKGPAVKVFHVEADGNLISYEDYLESIVDL
ncbi:MAG: hypothetical protein H6Q67_185 [Firmicutes bacterium]|nr:hypothetical protein [Bacillota bacterium]